MINIINAHISNTKISKFLESNNFKSKPHKIKKLLPFKNILINFLKINFTTHSIVYSDSVISYIHNSTDIQIVFCMYFTMHPPLFDVIILIDGVVYEKYCLCDFPNFYFNPENIDEFKMVSYNQFFIDVKSLLRNSKISKIVSNEI